MSGKEGVCFRTCRDDGDCMDVDAQCSEEGRCIPYGWEGWPEEENDENDEDVSDADGETSDEETDAEETDDEKDKKSDGCSVITV